MLIVLMIYGRWLVSKIRSFKFGQVGHAWIPTRLQQLVWLTYIAHLIPVLCPAILNMKTNADDFTKARMGLYSRPTTHVQKSAGVGSKVFGSSEAGNPAYVYLKSETSQVD